MHPDDISLLFLDIGKEIIGLRHRRSLDNDLIKDLYCQVIFSLQMKGPNQSEACPRDRMCFHDFQIQFLCFGKSLQSNKKFSFESICIDNISRMLFYNIITYPTGSGKVIIGNLIIGISKNSFFSQNPIEALFKIICVKGLQ